MIGEGVKMTRAIGECPPRNHLLPCSQLASKLHPMAGRAGEYLGGTRLDPSLRAPVLVSLVVGPGRAHLVVAAKPCAVASRGFHWWRTCHSLFLHGRARLPS